jgi:hypothetical protein
MKHKIEIAPNLAIYIDGERVIGSKPHGLFLTTEMIVSDEDLKRLSDRCLEVIVDTPQTDSEITRTSLRTDCNGCRFVGTYDTEFPCANCTRKNKDYYDAEQTDCEEAK